MNKIKILIATFAVTGLLLSSCEKFEDINENPNYPSEVSMGNVLKSQIMQAFMQNNEIFHEHGAGAAQQMSRPLYNDPERYNTGPVWTIFGRAYKSILNLKLLQEKALENNNRAVIGVAQVLEAYQLQLLTDTYGDIPYSESTTYDHAAGTIANEKPAYDTQESIYSNIIALLGEANTNLAAGITNEDIIPREDALFNGSIEGWQKFCNSLLLRVYIRISSVDANRAQTGITTILNAPATYPIISEPNDDAKLIYATNEASWNLTYKRQYDRPTDFASSSTFVNYLISMNDPRLGVYFDTIDGGTYNGYPHGEVGNDDEISELSSLFIGDEGRTRPEKLMSYTEVQLILAEAAQRTDISISGTAQSYYENAVNAQLSELSLDAAAYLAADGDFVAAVDPLQLIYREKWVSTYLENAEGWCLVRRIGDLGGLVLEVQDAFYNGHYIIKRIPYPESERNKNTAEWEVAVSRQALSVDLGYQWGTIWWETK